MDKSAGARIHTHTHMHVCGMDFFLSFFRFFGKHSFLFHLDREKEYGIITYRANISRNRK